MYYVLNVLLKRCCFLLSFLSELVRCLVRPFSFPTSTIVIGTGFIPISLVTVVLMTVLWEKQSLVWNEYCVEIDYVVLNAVFNVISVISRQPVQKPMLSWSFFFTSTPHNILFKPLAAFPHNHHWNNGQLWERN